MGVFTGEKSEQRTGISEKICLEDFMAGYELEPFIRWLCMFKKLEGHRVISVDLTNVPHQKTNPLGSIATLEIRVE